MPEGPEVRTVARTLAENLIGERLGSLWHSPYKLRRLVNYDAFKLLEKRRIDNILAYGKVLFIESDNKPVLMAQLGMTGQLTVNSVDEPLKDHTHVRWRILDSHKELRYVDPRRFGLIDICDEKIKHAIIKKLGPDPFTLLDQDRKPLIASMKKSARVIKEILLDQSIIVGVGNIYASEALFRAKINPEKKGHEIDENKYQKLITNIIEILNLAYKNCGTTFSNYVDGSGKKGENLKFLQVFQREHKPCFSCNSLILRIKQGGRSTFYCPSCQS
jgi:formamidopyrimidine-DNA glycosylase